MFDGGLAELHTHLGGSVASDILWSLAHEQGIALPVKDFWEFDRLVTVSDPRGVANLDALDQIYHWTELIQSSPIAVERSVHAAIGGAYRSQGITTLELRFNPMKRNRGGERDLDHIILAAIRGLDRASLEYPQVRAGLILMMDRTFTAAQNSIIVEKAGEGLAPKGEGWFVLNSREARWLEGAFGAYTRFEGVGDAKFPQLGINIGVLQPGQPACMYHAEDQDQEGFLVLQGEALLLVEGEERPLKAWDFFHCPAGARRGHAHDHRQRPARKLHARPAPPPWAPRSSAAGHHPGGPFGDRARERDSPEHRALASNDPPRQAGARA